MRNKLSLAIVIPVYNDWKSAARLLSHFTKELFFEQLDNPPKLYFIDDGSTDVNTQVFSGGTDNLDICILRSPVNLGHQRAIFAGLRAALEGKHTHFLVMDSDGEDTPDGVRELVGEAVLSPNAVIVAKRGMRSESTSFKVFYHVHRFLFSMLVGQKLDFGNFMIIPREAILKIVSMPERSIHLPAAILRLGLPIRRVVVDRGKRFFGKSKMNFERLVSHSFASLAVFADRIMVRVMIISFFSSLTVMLGALGVVATRILVESTTPGWATAAAGILIVLCVQILSFAGLGTLISLNVAAFRNATPDKLEEVMLRSEPEGKSEEAM